MKTFLITLLVLGIPYLSSSQNILIRGKISDIESKAIPFASVSLSDTRNEIVTSAEADSSGLFTFSVFKQGLFQIVVSSINYQSANRWFTITKDTTINILLTPIINSLQGVTVASNKPALSSGAGTTTLNVGKSITSIGADALNTIVKLPGIKINSNSLSLAGRGEIKVMINGHLLQLSGIDLIRYLKSLSSNQIAKIELIENPGANYEAEGNAGIINIITKMSKTRGSNFDLLMSPKLWIHNSSPPLGKKTYEGYNTNANYIYNSPKLSLNLSLNLDRDNTLEGFGTKIYYPHHFWNQTDTGIYHYENVSWISGIDYKIKPNISAGFYYSRGKSLYTGTDNIYNPVYSEDNIDSVFSTVATYHPVAVNNNINFHLISARDTGVTWSLNSDYFSYIRNDYSNFLGNTLYPNEPHSSIPASYFDVNKQDIRVFTIKGDISYQFKKIMFSLGSKISVITNYSNALYYNVGANDSLGYNSNLSNEFKYKENTQAVYLTAAQEHKNYRYQIGMRTEFTQTDGNSLTTAQNTKYNYLKIYPVVTVTLKKIPDHSFSFNINKRTDRPSFWDLNPFKSLYTQYSFAQGNPGLLPEYSTNFEISHTYKDFLISKIYFNVTRNGFNNVTVANTQTNLVFTTPINYIKMYRYGLSIDLSYNKLKWLEHNSELLLYHSSAYSSFSLIKDIKQLGSYLSTNNTIFINNAKTFTAALNFWYQFPELDHTGVSSSYYKLDIGTSIVSKNKMFQFSLVLNDALRSSASDITTTVDDIKQTYRSFQLNRFLQFSIRYHLGGVSKVVMNTSNSNDEEKGRLK